jgi:hypothetical protein
MGAFADAVNEHLRERLASLAPAFEWETEHYVAGTPVDLVGTASARTVCVELEWRRADPADNTAKLFRHLVEETLDAPSLVVCQVFTGYYDLVSGDVSSKRKNAEFVGRVAAERFAHLVYHPVEFDMTPPKRGASRPENWRDVADEVAENIVRLL